MARFSANEIAEIIGSSEKHAFSKHIDEFKDLGITTPAGYQSVIASVLNDPNTVAYENPGKPGSFRFYNKELNILVSATIPPTGIGEEGTCYRPKGGATDFENEIARMGKSAGKLGKPFDLVEGGIDAVLEHSSMRTMNKLIAKCGSKAGIIGGVAAAAYTMVSTGDAKAAVAQLIPGGEAALALMDDRQIEAVLRCIEEVPVIGTAASEFMRPLLRHVAGYDVDEGLIEQGATAFYQYCKSLLGAKTSLMSNGVVGLDSCGTFDMAGLAQILGAIEGKRSIVELPPEPKKDFDFGDWQKFPTGGQTSYLNDLLPLLKPGQDNPRTR